MEITHNQLKEQLKISYETKTPLFLWGGTGIGKSDTIKQTAQEIAKSEKLEFSEDIKNTKAFGFLDIRISQLEPSDLRGLPVQNTTTQKTDWLIPSWLPSNKESKGLIFFDELNLSPPSIQAVAYQLILDRRIGDYVLPEGWVIISAGNRVEDKCSVFEMSSALCNRFLHATLSSPSVESWTEWAVKNNIDGRIISFLNWKPSSFNRATERNKDKAFPTPRSWAFCSRLINKKTDNALVSRLCSSAVGEGTALEFIAFLKLQTKIDFESILKNPKQIKKIEEIDLKYALLGTLSERYHQDKSLLNKILPTTEYLEPEFAVLLLRFLKAYHPEHFKKEMLGSGKNILKKYADVLI